MRRAAEQEDKRSYNSGKGAASEIKPKKIFFSFLMVDGRAGNPNQIHIKKQLKKKRKGNPILDRLDEEICDDLPKKKMFYAIGIQTQKKKKKGRVENLKEKRGQEADAGNSED